MPIIHLISNASETFPEGAYCPIGEWNRMSEIAGYKTADLAPTGVPYGPVVLYTSHHGVCLHERERNMHDDSDFYMTVWNVETGKPEEIMFASTRGWSYPCMGSHVDATPEIRAEYEAWATAEQRRSRICRRWAQRNADVALARTAGLKDRFEVARLRDALPRETVEAVMKLLTTKTIRSAFRASLAAQVRTWLADPAPRYASPLSPKQLRWFQ